LRLDLQPRGAYGSLMSERFFLDEPLQLGPVDLTGPEVHHLSHVCRLRPGDELCLFNGDGQEYAARVVAVERRSVALEVLVVRQPQRELPCRLEIAAPIPKGDRGQFLVEKLTELGVTTFIPLSCQRSLIHPRESRRDKLQRHVIEASKQCGRNVLMRVGALTDWATYCDSAAPAALSLLAHPAPLDEEARLGNVAKQVKLAMREQPGLTLRLAVGPEGGFTDAEIGQGQAGGWLLLDLGPRVLRIETAALALAVLAGQWLADH
jgi:16S rRNA (uracil1498-N3)-methyltransferase